METRSITSQADMVPVRSWIMVNKTLTALNIPAMVNYMSEIIGRVVLLGYYSLLLALIPDCHTVVDSLVKTSNDASNAVELSD